MQKKVKDKMSTINVFDMFVKAFAGKDTFMTKKSSVPIYGKKGENSGYFGKAYLILLDLLLPVISIIFCFLCHYSRDNGT